MLRQRDPQGLGKEQRQRKSSWLLGLCLVFPGDSKLTTSQLTVLSAAQLAAKLV